MNRQSHGLDGSVETPAIFLAIPLRSGRKYRALNRHWFTALEKQWACSHILSSCEDIDVGIMSDIDSFCTRYYLSLSVVTAWMNQFADGVPFSEPICAVDAVGVQTILREVAIGAHAGEAETDFQNRLYSCFIIERDRTSNIRGY